MELETCLGLNGVFILKLSQGAAITRRASCELESTNSDRGRLHSNRLARKKLKRLKREKKSVRKTSAGATKFSFFCEENHFWLNSVFHASMQDYNTVKNKLLTIKVP